MLFLLGVGVLGAAEESEFEFSDLDKWHSTLNAEFKTGSRHIGQLGFVMPLHQDETSMFFFDFRGWVDDLEDEEYNAGLAYRKVLDDKIVGVYAFFDRHFSDLSRNKFDQITVGAEILGEVWDHRINAYIPTDRDGKSTGRGDLSIIRNRLYVSGIEERAYGGMDYEAGKLLKCFGTNGNEVRAYGGAFYFNNDAALYEAIAGPRLRLEMRLFDTPMLGEGSRVTISGEVTWDKVRETRGFAGIGFQIPLGKFGKPGGFSDTPFGPGEGYRSLSRLERRMLDPIVRDIDIITNRSGDELVNDAEGDPLFVTGGNLGVDGAISKAGRNGTAIVSGDYVTVGNHQLLNGQRLAGGDSIQTINGTTTGRQITMRLPGSRGKIRGTSSANRVVELADNTIVDSLHIQGGVNGIGSGGSVSNVTIINNKVTGAFGGSVGITGGGIGIAGTFTGLIANNTFSGNEGNGLFVGVNDGIISNNLSTLNGDDGLEIGIDNNGLIAHNRVINNGGDGIEVEGDNNGIIRNNFVSMTGENGIEVGDTNFGQVSGNIVMRSDDDGFDFFDNSGVISGNTVLHAGDDGLDLDGENRGTISDNTVKHSDEDGFSIGVNNGVVTSNTSLVNVSNGFNFGLNFSFITFNTATSNGLSGILVRGQGGAATTFNNISSGNGRPDIFSP